MTVSIEDRAKESRVVFIPIPPTLLPFVRRRPDNTGILALSDRPTAP
ncbi:MAG: hypothetical protein OXC65_08395 [Thiotrichales bacterium]|nr:hypothetical protein [Thiotrichales bacterium]